MNSTAVLLSITVITIVINMVIILIIGIIITSYQVSYIMTMKLYTFTCRQANMYAILISMKLSKKRCVR